MTELQGNVSNFSTGELQRALSHPSIEFKKRDETDGDFNRDFVFSISGNNYKIVWWANCCVLHMSCGAFVQFHKVAQSNTWPNDSKMNLQFENRAGETLCVIKIL